MWHPSLLTKKEKIYTAACWFACGRWICVCAWVFAKRAAKWAHFLRGRGISRRTGRRRRSLFPAAAAVCAHTSERTHWLKWRFYPRSCQSSATRLLAGKGKVAWFVPAAAAFTYHNYNIYYSQAAAAARTTCNYAALVPPTAQKTP
jgi:hypothetical protein